MTKIRTTRRSRVISFVKIISDLNRSLMGRVIDISATGARIRSKTKFKTDKPISFRILFPNINFREKMIKCDASVVWTEQSLMDGYYEAGLIFKEVTPKAKSIIEQFICDSSYKNKWIQVNECFSQEH